MCICSFSKLFEIKYKSLVRFLRIIKFRIFLKALFISSIALIINSQYYDVKYCICIRIYVLIKKTYTYNLLILILKLILYMY